MWCAAGGTRRSAYYLELLQVAGCLCQRGTVHLVHRLQTPAAGGALARHASLNMAYFGHATVNDIFAPLLAA